MESRGPVTGRYCRLCGSGRTVGQQYRNRYPFQSGCSEGLSGQQSPVAESLPVVFYSGVQPVIADGTAPGKRHRSGENRERTQERCDPGDHRNGRNASYRGNSREDFAGEQSEAQSAKLVNRNYAAMSFRDYYAVDVLDQVQEYLRENTGEEPQDYRVVSLGIDPAAALYHGFYCLDGYSNNYSLEYKHRFREIIAPELDKSEYLEDSFDHWGNRCYLFSAECPGYYTIEKGGFYFQDYTIDAESLRQLGGSYLLSAAYIDHSEDTGLELMRPEAFETENSYYRIYLYRVMDNE